MTDSEKHPGGREDRPVPPPDAEPTAPDTDAIGLSIEERGMVVMPQVSVPIDQIDVGNMPRADARPTGGQGGDGEGGSGSADPPSGEGASE